MDDGACIAPLPVAQTIRCHYLSNCPRQALSPVTCRHCEITATPDTSPPLTASDPPSSPLSSLLPPLPVPKRLPPANTSQYHLSVIPLPRYSDTASTGSVVAVAYAAATVDVVFAGAVENVQYRRIRTRRHHLKNNCIRPGVRIACFRPSCTESIASTNPDSPTPLPPKPFQKHCPQSLEVYQLREVG